MKKRRSLKPINTTPGGLAYAVKASYFKNASLTTLTGGAGTSRVQECWKSRKILHACADGTCKTIFARMGRLSWENYLGRLEHGGWDCQMTSVLEIWNVPMKGKGHEVTVRNIAQGEPTELARPLTTDPWDNALLYEERKTDADD